MSKPRQAYNGGRRSKGDRRTLYTRLPAELGRLIEETSETQDLPMSDVIANAVAQYFGRPPVAEPGPEGQMQLTA